MLFAVGESDRSTLGCERRATTFIMAPQPQSKVIGGTDVEGSVRTAEDVHAVHDDDDGIVGGEVQAERMRPLGALGAP